MSRELRPTQDDHFVTISCNDIARVVRKGEGGTENLIQDSWDKTKRVSIAARQTMCIHAVRNCTDVIVRRGCIT